jgi:hypothetical protein
VRRLTLLAASAALVTLALAAGAGSRSLTYTSAKIEVRGPAKLGATGFHEIHVILRPTDDPTVKVVIYAPAGYRANLSAASGSQVGTVSAKVQTADLGGATLPLSGVVNAAGAASRIPSGSTTVALGDAAVVCTGSPTHAAYWLLVLTAAGQTLQLPAYVDPAAGPETAFASFKIQVCLPPPDVPPGTPGRATFGVKLFDADLTLKNVFTNPTSGSRHMWSAIFTPYAPGAGTPDIAGTVEARSVVLLPVLVTLKGKYDARRHVAVLAGKRTVGQENRAGAAVLILSGPSPSKLEPAGPSGKTSSSGTFTATRKILETTYFQARFAGSAVYTQNVCTLADSPAPAGCVSGNVGPFGAVSSIVKVTVPKR